MYVITNPAWPVYVEVGELREPTICRAWSTFAQLFEKLVPFFEVPRLDAQEPSQKEIRCLGVVPTPLKRLDHGALMGDVLLSAFHAAFGLVKTPLKFSAVHSAA
jgi:hypothetical protein